MEPIEDGGATVDMLGRPVTCDIELRLGPVALEAAAFAALAAVPAPLLPVDLRETKLLEARFRFLIISVLRAMGRVTPCNL